MNPFFENTSGHAKLNNLKSKLKLMAVYSHAPRLGHKARVTPIDLEATTRSLSEETETLGLRTLKSR